MTGKNPNVYQLMKGLTNYRIFIQQNTTQQWKGINHEYIQDGTNLKNVILCEERQSPKVTYYRILFI